VTENLPAESPKDFSSDTITFEEAHELFFKVPRAARGEGWVSPMFLCRQELQDCFVGDIVGEENLLNHPPRRLFATAMVALSGIELMARMIPPPSKDAGSGELFVAMVTTYSKLAKWPISNEHAEVLLRLRNALSHTFGLYHELKGGAHAPLYLFSSNSPEDVVRERHDGSHEVCIEMLVRLFVVMVEAFRVNLLETPEFHATFLAAFKKYGRLYHRGPHIA
jgi:hypothetical protein